MSGHWSTDPTNGADDKSYLDDAWSAVENHLAGGEAEHVLETLAGGDPEASDAIDLTGMFLASHGLDYSTASPEETYAAALEADAWQANALETLHSVDASKIEMESAADELALANTLDSFVADHAGGDAELASDYLDIAMSQMENGVGFEDAMAQAAAILDHRNGIANEVTREDHFAAKGYEKGLKAAFATRRAEANNPAHRAHATPQKSTAAATDRQGLGTMQASKNAISNAVSGFAQRQREANAARELIKADVRRNR